MAGIAGSSCVTPLLEAPTLGKIRLRGLGFRGLEFRGLGFRGLGFRGLGDLVLRAIYPDSLQPETPTWRVGGRIRYSNKQSIGVMVLITL